MHCADNNLNELGQPAPTSWVESNEPVFADPHLDSHLQILGDIFSKPAPKAITEAILKLDSMLVAKCSEGIQVIVNNLETSVSQTKMIPHTLQNLMLVHMLNPDPSIRLFNNE